jgi:hypothetical protein
VEKGSDFLLQIEHVQKWESEHGELPAGSCCSTAPAGPLGARCAQLWQIGAVTYSEPGLAGISGHMVAKRLLGSGRAARRS